VTGADDTSAFRVAARRPAWTGRRIAVDEVEIAGPDGEHHGREVVRHPGAVGVVPVHDDGTVTLVRQYRAALDAEIWEIPAGLRDVDGEPPAETARRELIEEAGLSAGSVDHLVTFHNSPGFTDEAVVVYVAGDLTAVPDDRQGAEEAHMVVDRVSLADALGMVDDGLITDAKTVIALLALACRAAAGAG
jgi:ADP-ribose pyrophosphatase